VRIGKFAALGAAVIAAPALLAGSLLLARTPPPSSPHPGGSAYRATVRPTRSRSHAERAGREGTWLGVFERGTPAAGWPPIQNFITKVGVSPRLVLIYTGIGTPFPTQFGSQVCDHHANLLIQINPGIISLRAIADGAYDGWLRYYAIHARNLGCPVVIGFGHEMNGDWYTWGYKYQSPAQFVAAWRHVVTLFRRQHAANVTWLWTVSSGGSYTVLPSYWPGTAYVNWVGIDGYYYTRDATFWDVYGRYIVQIRKMTGRPILLSEVGIGQRAGQARTLPDLFAGIQRYRLLGLVWFDVDQSGSITSQDWRIEGHPAAIAAFRRGVKRMGTPNRI
jgi:Glycosyl hydrolase family 26